MITMFTSVTKYSSFLHMCSKQTNCYFQSTQDVHSFVLPWGTVCLIHSKTLCSVQRFVFKNHL